MAVWSRSFTYEPKIKAVQTGKCTQTIRPKHTVKVGDKIQFHGWEGRPYWSRWSWRMKVVVTDVIYIMAFKDGVEFSSSPTERLPWDNPYITRVAKMDGIDPPTGKAMGELFNSKYDLTEGIPMQIIRWDWPPYYQADAPPKKKWNEQLQLEV